MVKAYYARMRRSHKKSGQQLRNAFGLKSFITLNTLLKLFHLIVSMLKINITHSAHTYTLQCRGLHYCTELFINGCDEFTCKHNQTNRILHYSYQSIHSCLHTQHNDSSSSAVCIFKYKARIASFLITLHAQTSQCVCSIYFVWHSNKPLCMKTKSLIWSTYFVWTQTPTHMCMKTFVVDW